MNVDKGKEEVHKTLGYLPNIEEISYEKWADR
jgi:hypothetical protein